MRKTDYLLLAVICLVALAGYLFFHSADTRTAKLLIIQHDNKVIERIDLGKVTAETRMEVPVQDGTLTLMYDKKGAWVESSPCPEKLCIHQGKITRTGQTIACLPEKVLLTITTPGKEAEFDAIIR
jgi:hypothetical protein